MPNEIVTKSGGTSLTRFDEKQIALIARTIAKDATRDELALFIGQCMRTGLDPFTRQIYFMKDRGGRVSVITSIDGFRLIAQRGNEYAGQDEPIYEMDEKGKLISCRVTVWKWHGETRYPAAVGVAYWDEYAKPGTNGKLSTWDKMPRVMLAKCAEAVALRKAFPNDLSGIYSQDEMDSSIPPAGAKVTTVEAKAESVVVPDEQETLKDQIDSALEAGEIEHVENLKASANDKLAAAASK